jgi:7-cyano-7-deazaguanine synthase
MDGSSSICRMISRDPLDLVAQAIGANHQYPDGFVLFLGTMFAPTQDRHGPGQGFTHVVGDLALGEDHLLDLAVLGQVSDTSLTRDVAFKMESSGLPNTFVPGRNLLFLTLAAALAYRRDLQVLVTGVCETDFSGYPDCRDDTMKAMQLALSLGMDKRFLIETPLMWIDKADTWRLARSLGEKSGKPQGGEALVNLIVEHTHTCYLGDRVHRHAWGYGCGTCPACELRARGFERYVAAG